MVRGDLWGGPGNVPRHCAGQVRLWLGAVGFWLNAVYIFLVSFIWVGLYENYMLEFLLN